MKVSELPYQRVTIEQFQAVMRGVVDRIRRAGNVEEILAAREDYLGIMTAYMTASSLSYMRYSINTADEFYVAEKDYYDQIGPEAESACLDYANALLESPFRPELEQKLSPVLFRSLEVQKKSMSPEIVPDMVEENKIVTEYSRLMASMEFEFRGEKMPRSILMKYAKEEDRQTRRACYEVLGRTMAQYAEQLDDTGLFDVLGADGVCVIEWGDKFADQLGDERLDICLMRLDDMAEAGEEPARLVCLEPHGPRAQQIADALA